jgi:hypothetical protein
LAAYSIDDSTASKGIRFFYFEAKHCLARHLEHGRAWRMSKSERLKNTS